MIEQIAAKNLLNRVKYNEWFGADYNMNLYRGCCHGCIYCDSRSECYHVEDFDRVRVKAGGKFVFSMYGVTLRANQRQYFYDRLDERFPGLSARYRSTFGGSYYCPAPRHDLLKALVQKECRAHGLLWRMPDIIRAYRGGGEQLSLF